MEFSSAQTDRGHVFNAGQAFVHIPDDAARMQPLVHALADFVSKATETAGFVKPELLPSQFVRSAEPLLTAASRTIAATIANAKDVATAHAQAMVPPPAVAEAANRYGAEVRARFRAFEPGEQVASISRATAVELAALLEADGSLSGLLPQALDMARERALKLWHVERTGLGGRNPSLPSLDRIIATGTDDSATDVQADAALLRLKQRVEAVEADEAVMQHLVGFIASALAIHPSHALEKIMAAG